MENVDTPTRERYGLPKIGYVVNFKDGVYIKELQDLLSDTEHEPTSQEIRKRADTANLLFLNKNGYETDSRGKRVTESTAIYKAFDTGYDLGGQHVYGWFEKNENGRFDGVTWGTMQQLRAYAQLKNKMSYLFKMGDFYFENIDGCQEFLEDIAMLTSATFISKEIFNDLKQINLEDLGEASIVKVYKDKTLIIGGITNQEKVEEKGECFT